MQGVPLAYLDRHPVDCGSGRALQQWQVQYGDCTGADFQVAYRCAELGEAPPLSPPASPASPYNFTNFTTANFTTANITNFTTANFTFAYDVHEDQHGGDLLGDSQYECAPLPALNPGPAEDHHKPRSLTRSVPMWRRRLW